ncbi:MAG: type VI secretion system membrane subunit TssM [Gammaproteobacteria bacterium]|nr:type VI secretion system membrane subunit TssM [Gammaproteobacteria bacterium]
MKKIISFFTNRIVISLIGLIALSVIIWVVGPHIKFGRNNAAPLESDFSRLVGIIILLLVWGVNNLRIQFTHKGNNRNLVEDLEKNQELTGEKQIGDQKSEESELLKQRFRDAITTLSKLKFKGKSHSRYQAKALYELPWYIIIGPPGSGKTTALVNSSLEFPLAEQFGKAALQGGGGTRNCDWWFTNEAVLIDTAGRYTTQDSHKLVDSSAWEAFLSLLKKNRRRRPVNGVLVAISMQDLLFQTEQERNQNAKTIRTRIDELMQKLEVRFPIYLMLTKSDLVSGFSEYFEDLSKEDREQVWGVSLPNAEGPSQSPDFDYLETELNRLISRLYSRELSRVHQERDVKRRALIQGFPQQLENIKTIVESFVKQTFITNRYEYQPYLRGVYFTSGTQNGTPIDRMMSAVSENFGFDQHTHTQPVQGKSFFLGKLFREVIFPESELGGLNRKYEAVFKWSRRLGYAALLLTASGLLAAWFGSLSRHDNFMLEVERYVAEYDRENTRLQGSNKDIRGVIPSLNALARASIVYDQDQFPWLSGFGLYDGNVDSAADDAYRTQLRLLMLPRLLAYLEESVSTGHKGGDLYHNFRTYLMFNKIEHMDRELVIDWFRDDWKINMQGEASQRKALEQHLEVLLNLDIESQILNPKLVRQTRKLLLRVPVHQRIYSRIRTRSENREKVNLLNRFGESVREVYRSNIEIEDRLQMPFMFTKAGYDGLDFSTSSPVIADIVNERWVLSDDNEQKVDFIKDDLEEISGKVGDLYFAEFIKHWASVLKTLDVAEFKSIDQAADVLSQFVDPVYSPLQAILQVTSENTQLTSPVMQNLDDDQAEASASATVTAKLAGKFNGTPVDQRFRPLSVLLREARQKPAPIIEIEQKLIQLKEFMGEITVSPDADKKAFEIALARYKQGSGNAITSMRKFASKQPPSVKRWLTTLSDQSWKVILSAARRHVNVEWTNQVYGFYREALADRYPLSRKSKNELAQLDFSDFFKPGGNIDRFFIKNIKPFISSNANWKNKLVDGRSPGFSKKSLEQLKKALAIKSIFFRKNVEVPGISLQLKPDQLNKIDARFWLDVGDQRIDYNHGPKFWKDLNWSVEDDNSRVRLVFEDLDGDRHEKSFEGPWAWLRLLDESRISETEQSNVYLIEYSVDDSDGSSKRHTMKFLIKARSVNNPFNQNLLGLFKAPERI